MKRNISLALAALFCATTPMFAETTFEPKATEKTQPVQVTGAEAVASIRKAYARGDYKDFLKQMESDYQQAQQKGELKNLVDFRMGPADEKWIELEKTLRSERSQSLLTLVSQEKSTSFVQKVRSAATELSPEIQEAFAKISSFRYLTPNSGKNSDENKLIDLDLAYEYKALHLDLPTDKPAVASREKHYALKMEQMDRLVQASKSFQDPELKKAVALAAANLDTLLAQNWDRVDLNALAKGRIEPTSKLEEKAAALLSANQEKFWDLSKQLLDENTK